jgi:hypothetical protein
MLPPAVRIGEAWATLCCASAPEARQPASLHECLRACMKLVTGYGCTCQIDDAMPVRLAALTAVLASFRCGWLADASLGRVAS